MMANLKFFSGLMLFAVASAVSAPSFAVDWQYIAGANRTAVNMDFDSLATANGFRKAWVKINHFEEQTTSDYPAKKYHSQMMLYYFDCKAKTLVSTQFILYSKFNGDGEVVSSRSIKFNPANLDDVVPGSFGESMLNVACGTPASRAALRAKNDAELREFLKAADDPAKRSSDGPQT